MRRIAALFLGLLLAGVSTPALADITGNWGDPPEQPTDKQPSTDPGSKKSCAVNYEDDAILGVAALALLVAGVALRRRGHSDAQPVSA